MSYPDLLMKIKVNYEKIQQAKLPQQANKHRNSKNFANPKKLLIKALQKLQQQLTLLEQSLAQ